MAGAQVGSRRRDLPTHAGVVPFRYGRRGDDPEFLVVEASRHPGEWVFPKGHIEEGETVEMDAEREAAEEAGVSGDLIDDLGLDTFAANGKLVRVRWHLLEVDSEHPSPERRRKRWLSRAAALAESRFPEQRALVERASAAIALRIDGAKR